MKLFFDDGKGQTGAFPLDGGRVTIGRSSDCDLVIADERVSRVHAYVEGVSGQYLLQDAGSSNGTFLNGMRLRPQTGASLREGDVVEIGNMRFLYASSADERPAMPLLGCSSLSEIVDGSYPLQDLLRDGQARGAAAIEERSELLRAFVGVSPMTGIERCLEIVARRVCVDSVAAFMKGRDDGIQAVAWRPGADVARSLASVARRAWKTQEGRLIRGYVGGLELVDMRETTVRPLYSAGAVPFFDSGQPIGVLAVERVHEKRLDRVELAQLAALADAIAVTLCFGDRSPTDTRIGFGGSEGPKGAVAPAESSTS